MTLREAAAKFHLENPHIYALFDRFVRELIRAGRLRYSSRAVFERIRWHMAVETSDPHFKLNDHHTPYYARMWMRENPEYPDFFEIRILKAQIWHLDPERPPL
jgi:hypothetical protein